MLFTAAALVLVAGGWAQAQSAAVRPPLLPPGAYRPTHSLTHPDWVDESLEPSGRAHIAHITQGQADVVLLNGGLYQGFRNGVDCVIQRKGDNVARLVVVACEDNRCAALITQRENVIVMPGDEVRVSSMSPQ